MLGIEMFVHGTASIAYVIGPVADEGVYFVLYKFEEGLISKEQAIE